MRVLETGYEIEFHVDPNLSFTENREEAYDVFLKQFTIKFFAYGSTMDGLDV